MKKILLLFSFLFFASVSHSQSVTIIQPNGGEVLYYCETYTITWSQTGSVSNFWDIDYSLDNGLTWASVTSNYLSTDGTFNWTVPEAVTTLAKIRITDTNNGSTTDQSDAVFSIQTSVELTSPIGGETLAAFSTHQITWNAAGTSSFYTIQYSLNGGSSWNTIVSNHLNTTGVYDWDVPNFPSQTCRIRVYDQQEFCKQDISSSNFTIEGVDAYVTSFNLGGTVHPNCSTTIQWDASTFYSTVRLDYSTDNGVTWNVIDASETNDGSFTWYSIPNTPSDQCLVRVMQINDVNQYDVNDTPFTIAEPITITAPVGGENVLGCGTIDITFEKSYTCIGDFELYYSTDNGTTWNWIAEVGDLNTLSQTYEWNIPNTINSSNVTFKVESESYPSTMSDETVSPVTITPSNDITVTSPNGNEEFDVEEVILIDWTNTPDVSGFYTIQYSSGGSWSTVESNYTANTYSWEIPNNPSTNYKVRVLDSQNLCKNDESDEPFTVNPKTPIMNEPNGGETLYPNCSFNVEWDPSTYYGTVRIEYSTDNGVTWNVIDASETNDGYFTWYSIPNIPSNQCLVRVLEVSNPSRVDQSNSTFTIAEPITITAPVGGENVLGCGTIDIEWEKSYTCIGDFELYYSTDGGTTWNWITEVGDLNTLSQTYTWNIPNTINSANVTFKVESESYPSTMSDETTNPVTITPSNDITVTYPNGGEEFEVDSMVLVQWTNTSDVSGFYTVQYSSGGSWSTIENNYVGNAVTWEAPNNPTTNYKVRVMDTQNTCKNDESDTNFTVNPRTPVMTEPNGGEVLYPNCSFNVEWDASTFYGTVRIEYSTDNGITWDLIDGSETNDGYFTWYSIPNIQSDECLVRVLEVSDPSRFDVSDAPFTITDPITIISPTMSTNGIGCGTVLIEWEKSYTCIGDFELYYSTDSGVTWNWFTEVGDLNTLTQSYNWTVPNGIDVNTAMIKVESESYPEMYDVSEVFSIQPSNDITVSYPNGGEDFDVDEVVTISWSNLPTASGFYTVQYSSGGSWSTIENNYVGNAVSWEVPNNPTSNYKIRVLDSQNSCKYDESDESFTVNPRTPVMTEPNGEEVLYPNCSFNIEWDASTFYGTVRIEYSTNNGATWEVIDASETNDGYFTWYSIPNIQSEDCLVRVIEVNNPTRLDVSDAPFTITDPITIISPTMTTNGIGCGSVLIEWEKSYTCIGDFELYYSIDNGVTWDWFAEVGDLNTLTQSFDWTVPNGIDVNTAMIKVESESYPEMYDVSEAFSIQPSNDITVTYPNGGESFDVGDEVTITWNNLPTASGFYTILYSSGGSWSTIENNYIGNAVTWQTPNTPTSNYRIRVLDTQNGCKLDESDANFTVNPRTPVMTEPNGEEVMYPNCSFNIEWDASTFYGTVRIEYSTNNGTTWDVIDGSETNDGYFTWYSIPNIQSEDCLVRVIEISDPTRFDVSDAPFTITDPITIVSPTMTTDVLGCDYMVIEWEKSYSCIGDFELYYSIDSGVTWDWFTEVGDLNTLTQSYNWQVPNGIDVNTAMIKVESESYPEMYDVSEAFTITSTNDITLTYPNGGEVFQVGEEIDILWDNLPGASGQYTLQYKAGGSWTNIASNIAGNGRSWQIPNAPTTTAEIRIYDYNNTCKVDYSDAYFTIEPKDALVTSPNGGEVFYAGNYTYINWDVSTFYTNVRIDYSLNGGVTWSVIDSNDPNDGSYYWNIPNHNSTDVLVRVSHYNDANHYDVSDALFTIKPAVTILTPNGDNGNSSFLGGCTITSISIDRSSAWNQYTIQYSTDAGNSWNTITSNWTTNNNPATYDWNIPNIASSECLIKVYPNSVSSYADESDNTFTIEQPVTLIQPNFGGTLQVGSTYDITWASDGISNVYDLYYSTTNGASWINIITGYTTSDNTYTWAVPNNISSNCLIRVEDNVDDCKSDISDVTFSITNSPVPITVTAPNGGENLDACSTYTITWNEPTILGAYDIAYSIDGGASWITIVTNYATTDGVYVWDIPAINSTEVLIRVKEHEGTAFDLSDAFFSLDYFELTASPAISTIELGGSIQLMATGGFNTYVWTPSTGLDNPNIANPLASPVETTTYTVTSSNGVCDLETTLTVEVDRDVYVDHTAMGLNNGSSWADAYTDLQSALDGSANRIIHIAEGTYKPTTGTSRGAVFDMPDNTTLIGGYPNGGGPRSLSSNETILSGNVDGVGSADGNSYHVVRVKDVNNVVIDGVTIRDGNANVSTSFGRARGGGIYVTGATVTFSNCEFKWNRAIFGGALFATQSPNVTFDNCVFKNNTAGNGAALYHSNETNMYINNSVITNNNSTIRCALEVNNSLYTKIDNTVIANNASKNANAIGFIATNRNQTCDIYNSTILGETKNKYLISMQVGNNDELGLNVYNSIIAHQTLSFDKAFVAYNNNILNLNTENCYIQGSSVIGASTNNLYSATAGDLMLNADYSVNECSPVVNAGNDSRATDYMTDVLGNNRFFGTVDMGAFEAQTSCIATREIEDNVEVTDLEIRAEVVIYPNPVNDRLFIKSNLDEINIFIYDVLGKRVLETNDTEIDLSELPTGMYHVNVFSEGDLIKVEKVMKR